MRIAIRRGSNCHATCWLCAGLGEVDNFCWHLIWSEVKLVCFSDMLAHK